MTGDEPVTWEVRLGDQQPQKRLIVFGLAILAGLIGMLFFRSFAFFLVGVAVVVFAAAEMFLPMRFSLDDKGASARCGLSLNQILWQDVKRVVAHREAILLSPLEKPSRLDAFRGVYLRLASNEGLVSAKIRALVPSHAHFLGTGTDGGGEGSDDRKDVE